MNAGEPPNPGKNPRHSSGRSFPSSIDWALLAPAAAGDDAEAVAFVPPSVAAATVPGGFMDGCGGSQG